MVTAKYIQKVECPNCHRMVQTWTHIENCMAEDHKAKCFAVMVSAHGNNHFVPDEPVRRSTRGKKYTFKDAVERARHAESIGDTIGLRAKVIDIRTRRELAHY
jgi:hypothetical protein